MTLYVGIFTRCNVEIVDGVKVVKKRTKWPQNDPILPSVTPVEAAKDLVAFLTSFGSKNINLMFHGKDSEAFLPFLERAGVKDEFKDCVKHIIDTQGFFKQVQDQNNRNHGMKTIVEDWGNGNIKKLYQQGAHGALTDAICLAKLCYCRKLKDRFQDWLSLERFKKCLESSFM